MSKKGKRRRDAERAARASGNPNAPSRMASMRETAALVVRDNLRGTEEFIGGPHMQIMSLPVWEGDMAYFGGRQDAITQIDVDLPLVLPLKEDIYRAVLAAAGPVAFKHTIAKRGAERFSSLDTTSLPRFSHLSVRVAGFEDGFVFAAGTPAQELVRFTEVLRGGDPTGLEKLPRGKGVPVASSYLVICELLDKLVRFAGLPANARPRLSYSTRVYTEDNRLKAEATSHYPGEVLTAKAPELRFDPEQWELFARASALVNTDWKPSPSHTSDFSQRVFEIGHDFCFYCRQHPDVISKLEEELVRDLLLIVFKATMGAEGEAFHHGGKLDFKVVNPRNRYEFVTGELKWWDREGSVRKAFSQLAREHATGQEAALICLLLSKNRDATSVDEKARELMAAEPEFRGPWSMCAPDKSKEVAYKAALSIRGAAPTPLFYLLANVYPGRD